MKVKDFLAKIKGVTSKGYIYFINGGNFDELQYLTHLIPDEKIILSCYPGDPDKDSTYDSLTLPLELQKLDLDKQITISFAHPLRRFDNFIVDVIDHKDLEIYVNILKWYSHDTDK